MAENKKIFTDFLIFENPDLSIKANKFYKFFMPFLGLIWIMAGSVNLLTNGNRFLNILQIVFGSILLLLFIFQQIFYKKIGRLYISFGVDSIEIKKKYLKPFQNISWDEIFKIKFQYSKFMIYRSNNQPEVIKVEVPYSKNEEIRQQFRKFANLKSFEIEE